MRAFSVKSKICYILPTVPVYPRRRITVRIRLAWVSHFRYTNLNYNDSLCFPQFRNLHIIIPGWILWDAQVVT